MPLRQSKAPTKSPAIITAPQAVRYARASINTIFGQARTAQRDLYRRAWQGMDYTPRQYFTELGKDGVEMLNVIQDLCALVEAITPGTIPPDKQIPPTNFIVTRKPDGSVTVRTIGSDSSESSESSESIAGTIEPLPTPKPTHSASASSEEATQKPEPAATK